MIPVMPTPVTTTQQLIFFILGLVISAFLLWIGTKLAGIHNASFGKAVAAALISIVVLAIVRAAGSYIPLLKGIIGWVIGILVSVYIIKAVFDTSWGKAFLAWILYIVAVIMAVVIAAAFGIILFVGFP